MGPEPSTSSPTVDPIPVRSPDQKFSEYAERAVKVLPLVLAAMYLVGFVVVAYRLAVYGASSLELVRIQYLAAGFWFGMVVALYYSVSSILRLTIREYVQKWFSHRKQVKAGSSNLTQIETEGVGFVSAFLTAFAVVSAYFFYLFLGRFDHNVHDPDLYPGRYMVVFIAFLDITINFTSFIKVAVREGRRDTYFAQLYQVIVLFAAGICVVQFSKDLYPLIPFSWGGGQTRQVRFWLGSQPKDQPNTFLDRDGTSEYSVTYDLLLENENSYVVISPKAAEKSMVFDKKSVQAMIVLGSKTGPANLGRNAKAP